MSVTTALDLLERADRCIRDLRDTDAPTTTDRWESFDDTVYRLLVELIGLDTQHIRTADPSRRALDAAIRTYPTPLRPPVDTWLRPTQVARYENRSRTSVVRAHRAGLHVVTDGDAEVIHSRHVEAQSRAHPADPADPHPLSRAATALGVLADLVHDGRATNTKVLAANGEVAGAVQHVLTLTTVAARHTIAYGDLDDAVRPLLVGRYAEHAVDDLRATAMAPAALARITSISTSQAADPAAAALASAAHHWTRIAREELTRPIPSIEVLTQTANQGGHLCRVRAGLENPESKAATQLRRAEELLRRSEAAWGRLTTLTRPSHEFVTASRALFEALVQTSRDISTLASDDERRTRREALDLALDGVCVLFVISRTLPQRLLDAHAIRGPARQLQPADDRLQARALGRHVAVRPSDAPELPAAWEAACATLRSVTREVQGVTAHIEL